MNKTYRVYTYTTNRPYIKIKMFSWYNTIWVLMIDWDGKANFESERASVVQTLWEFYTASHML